MWVHYWYKCADFKVPLHSKMCFAHCSLQYPLKWESFSMLPLNLNLIWGILFNLGNTLIDVVSQITN